MANSREGSYLKSRINHSIYNIKIRGSYLCIYFDGVSTYEVVDDSGVPCKLPTHYFEPWAPVAQEPKVPQPLTVKYQREYVEMLFDTLEAAQMEHIKPTMTIMECTYQGGKLISKVPAA